MDMLKYKDIIEEGDLVIVYISVKSLYPLTVKHGEVFQNKYGALKHSDIIGKKFGSIVNCSRGWIYVLYPTPELWTVTLPHRTQILYSADISAIAFLLDLKPGSIVCEAGTGSGSLSHALARTISPDGCLHTFDFHEERVNVAQQEFNKHGLGSVVKIKHRDVGVDGFGLQHVADAVFLDLPQPWDVIPHVPEVVKLNGGRICSFSPCIEQVQRTCLALKNNNFTDISTIECLQKQFEVKRVTLSALKPEKLGKKLKTMKSTENNNKEGLEESIEHDMSLKSPLIRDSFWAATSPLSTPGHTGYLTVATFLSNPSCTDKAA